MGSSNYAWGILARVLVAAVLAAAAAGVGAAHAPLPPRRRLAQAQPPARPIFDPSVPQPLPEAAASPDPLSEESSPAAAAPAVELTPPPPPPADAVAAAAAALPAAAAPSLSPPAVTPPAQLPADANSAPAAPQAGPDPLAGAPPAPTAGPAPLVVASAPRVDSPDPTGGGPTQDDLPADVATLYDYNQPGGGASPGGVTAPTAAGAQQGGVPPPKIGTLTSLLDPPPGFRMPPLSDAQRARGARLQKMRQGLATVVYTRAVSNFDGTNMNCGLGYINDHFKDFFVGIPQSLYRGGELCGLCVRMWCVDSVCAAPLLRNDTFLVADSCADCQGQSLVASARGMEALSGVDVNNNPSLQVAWEFTSCAPLVESGIKMLPSDNNSPVFLGLNFSNLKGLIKAARINGMEMKRTAYGFWAIDTPGKPIPLRPPYALELAGVNGQVIGKRLASLSPQDLGVNFDA